MHFKEWLNPLRHNENNPQDIFWIGIDPYVEPPKPNEKWYRGHPHNNSRVHAPLWLTRSKEDALFYGNVGTYQISPNIKLGTYKDLVRAVRESEAKRDEIKPNSGFYGHNDNDFVYIPKVQKKLKQMNIDALLIKDVMANYEIDTLIVFNKSTITNQWLENDQEHAQALKQTGFWGRKGAGAIIVARDTGRILLPHRSQSVEQPNTWGVWGGAIDSQEDPESAARREVYEEAGAPEIKEMIPLHVFRKGDFSYHNFLAIVPHEFKPKLNWETQGYRWINYGDWPRPMHFGLESLIRNSGEEIRMSTEPQVQEMALKSYRTNFKREPMDDEGFGTHQGKPDLGNQVYQGVISPVPIQGRFSKKDRAIITHPRTMRTLERRLARSGYDFNILMMEPEDNRSVDGGVVIRTASKYNEGVEDFMRENGIRREGHITFVKNGSSGHVLTPWMILHTLGHAVTNHVENYNLPGRTPMKTLMNLIAVELDPKCKGGVERLPEDRYVKCLDLVGSVFMFKSARPGRYSSVHSDPEEFLNELIAEYLWNGDEIRIRPPHQQNPEIALRVEEMKEIVRSLLNLCVGKIIYDYI